MRSIAWLCLVAVSLAQAPSLHADEFGGAGGARARPPRGRPLVKEEGESGRSSRGKNFGFFLEPYVGYSYAKGEVIPGTNKGYMGLTFGGQLGAAYKSYFLAGRYQSQSLGTSIKDTSMGVVAGMTLANSPVRFTLGINFSDKLDNGNGQTLAANSFPIAISYYVSNSVVANLEYLLRDFSRVTIDGQSIVPSMSALIFSISVPIMFGVPSMPEMAKQNSTQLKEAGVSLGDWNI
jgi:hypothetical protein